MYIATMTEGPAKDSLISKTFSDSKYLLIFNYEKNDIVASYPAQNFSEYDLANKIIEHDCEAVICGPIEEEAFIVIADQGCVTRYDGVGYNAQDAIKLMQEYKLGMITDFIGGTGCETGEGVSCDGRHEDDN